MATRYLVLNDPHLDAKAPSSKRTDDYEQACFTKLEHVLHLAVKHNCRAILSTGDWFHQKQGYRVPHRLVQGVMQWLTDCRTMNIGVLSIAGNHDVPHGDTAPAVLRGQPYGVLMTHSNFHHLNGGSVSLRGEDGDEGDVWVTGESYRPPLFDEAGGAYEDPDQFRGASLPGVDDIAWVHLIHASAMPKAPIWAPYTLVEEVVAQTHADVIHCGHIHEDLGIWTHPRDSGGTAVFTNTGSMTRGSLTEETLDRIPCVLLVEHRCAGGVWTRTFDRLPLHCAPAAEIYDIAGYRDAKTKTAQLSEWGDQLRRELAETTDGEDESLPALIGRTESLDSHARVLALGILDTLG